MRVSYIAKCFKSSMIALWLGWGWLRLSILVVTEIWWLGTYGKYGLTRTKNGNVQYFPIYVHSGTAEKNDGGLTKHLHYVGSNTQFPIICKVWNAHIFQVSMRLKQYSWRDLRIKICQALYRLYLRHFTLPEWTIRSIFLLYSPGK